MGDKLKKSVAKQGLFAFLAVLLFVSMGGFVNADVLINEFLANGIIEPDSEWVELYNNVSSAVDLTGFKISETNSGNLTLNLTIPAKGFVILVENFTLFNSTFSNLNSTGLIVDYGEVVPSFQLSNTAGLIELYNASGDKIDSIEYAQASTQENVSIGRHPDGTKNIVNLSVQTPGAKNDNVAPVFNKWIIPSSNKTVVLSSLNITVNITDDASTVNASLVNFNGTNFSMTKSGDLWFFLWSISKAIDNVAHNVTVYFNDSNGFGSSNTIFNITAGHPPDFNKWINPSANNSFISGLFNVTVNITDAVNKVNVSLINFNNNNFSMSKNEDLWYFVWNTSPNAEKPYNITIFFNDSLGFSNTNTLFGITVDNTKPNITAPITNVNSRNYANPGFNFNASVNATDTNLLNVTCTLSGTTVANFSNDGKTYNCNLTSALAAATASNPEQDFIITFTAADKANNTNSTTISFTTKHTTATSLKPMDITVSGLNQSDKIVEVNATLNNTGSSSMYDTGIIIDSFSTTKLSATSVSYKSCSSNINNSQTCNATFNVTVAGGLSSGTYRIFWNANWTNNNFTKQQLSQAVQSLVTVASNPQMAVPKNDSATITHAKNSTLILHINSTGNSALNDINITFVQNTLQSSWINISDKKFSSISAAVNGTFNVTVAIPKYTNPGNYTGTINITSSDIPHKTTLLTVEVPTDSSWISSPNKTITYRKSGIAGIAGSFALNNTGNIGHNFTFYPPTGDLFFYLWNNSNERNAYVEAGQTRAVPVYHLQMDGNAPQSLGNFNATFTIRSENTSQSNTTFMSLVRDDNNPFANITNPIANSFVKGAIEFNATAADLNLSRLEYFINNSLVLNSTEINFTFISFRWNTNNGSYSDEVYKLKAIAFDSAGNVNQSEVTVTVNNTDSLPVLRASIPTINIVEDDNATLNLSLFFESIDGDSLKYNFTRPDNITVHVTNTTQIANFTPAANFTGLNYIMFTAIDTSNQTTSSNNVTINVANVNDAPTTPVLTSPKSGSNVTSSGGKAALVWSASTDVDNDAITYYVFVSNDSSNIKFNATTTATTLQLTNLGNNVAYYWKALASDNLLNSSNSSIFNFTIIRDNNPVINKWTWNNTITASSTNASPIVAENRTLNFIINASDPDNNPVNFTWFRDSLEISNVQNFTFNLTNNFTAAGTYTLKLQVQENNSNSVSQEWTVTVTGTNREPVLDGIIDKTIAEDSLLTFNITSFDPDNDSLAFTSNATSILFTNAANNSLATVNWTPTNDNIGNNPVEFRVKDSSKNASQTITITVTNTNDAPTITDFFPRENKTIAKNAGIQKFNVTFNDVDTGDDATAYWFRNTTLIAPNSSNATITSLQEGIYNITAIVNDTSGAKARYEWKLNVTADILGDGLTSPVLSLNETQRENVTNVMVNRSIFGGIDFGNETLNLTRVVKLEDAFNISKGIVAVNTKEFPKLNKSAFIAMKDLNFTKAPLIFLADEFESTAGILCPDSVCTNKTYDAKNGILRFRVTGFSTYFTQTNTTNGAPIITSTPVKTATENAKYTYDAEATDPDGDVLTFSLITKPSGMSIGSSTGVISWTPTTNQLGLNNVIVNVSDGSLTAEQSFNITVGKGPKLTISDLDVKVDTKTDKSMQNNTKISKEAAPGSKVEFKLEVENLFTDDEDLEIEDIDVEITIEDIDDGDDLDEDADEFDLKAGKNEDVSIEFDIPLEVDEDIYDVIISVEGQDENQTAHEILWNLELEVEKEVHEIRILKADITPLTISCQRQVALNSEIINTGTEDEDDVTLEITSPELGISSVTSGIELDEGTDNNRFTKQLTESIGKDISAGVYPVTFNVYYDSSLSEAKTVDLTIEECELTKAVKEKVKEKKPDVGVIRPKVAVEKPEAKTAEPSFKQTSEYRTLLAIMVIVFIGTAVFIVGGAYMLLKK